MGMLAGCAGTPAAAPTVTVTVEATPSPVPTVTAPAATRSATDPLTALDAWTACYAAVHSEFDLTDDADTLPYEPSAVTPLADGAFEVEIVFPGILTTCTIAGSLARPLLTLSSIDI
jgi:hypothetical protein